MAGPLTGAGSADEPFRPPLRTVIALTDAPIRPPRVLFSGSFHPMHASHLRIAELASEMLGERVDLEISVRNVEKPPLEGKARDDRIAALKRQLANARFIGHLWLTSAPTFVEKVILFPGTTFVVGLDTLRRISDPRFHGGEAAHQAALDEMATWGARFLVFFRHLDRIERWDDPGQYPARLARMLQFVPFDRYADPDRLASRRLRLQ